MPFWTNKAFAALRFGSMWFTGLFLLFIGLDGFDPSSQEPLYSARIYAILNALLFFALPFMVAKNQELPEPERVTMNGGMGFWKPLGS